MDHRLQEAIASFDFSRYGPLDTPSGALTCCIETSEGFAAHCADGYDLDAEVIDLTVPPPLPHSDPAWLGQPRSEWIHTVTRVAGRYIDWTARQFDPAAAFPALADSPFGWEGQKVARTYRADPSLDLA